MSSATTSSACLASATCAMRRASSSDESRLWPLCGTALMPGTRPRSAIRSATASGTRWRIGSPAATRRRIPVEETPISGIAHDLGPPGGPQPLERRLGLVQRPSPTARRSPAAPAPARAAARANPPSSPPRRPPSGERAHLRAAPRSTARACGTRTTVPRGSSPRPKPRAPGRRPPPAASSRVAAPGRAPGRSACAAPRRTAPAAPPPARAGTPPPARARGARCAAG